MKELIILIGNVGSGKSTLVKQYQEKGYVVIARDNLRYAIGGGKYVFNVKYEPIIKEIEETMLYEFLELDVNIIIDETNMTKMGRDRFIFLAKSVHYKIKAIELRKLSKKESVDRRMTNPHGTPDRKVWEGVWEKFNDIYESPTTQEGFDEVIKL